MQYNGFQPGWLPQNRNIGETLGVLSTINFVDPKTGKVNPEPLRWQTSVQIGNLIWMETTLSKLRAPTWPADVFGPIDQAKAEHGKTLFTQYCASCHAIRELPNGVWDVNIVPLQRIRTDPNTTTNWSATTYDASKLGLDKIGTYEALPIVLNRHSQAALCRSKNAAGPAGRESFMEAPCGYKARPLIGVWSTPPFLHNGSVRTVFDLLSETRPAKFTRREPRVRSR